MATRTDLLMTRINESEIHSDRALALIDALNSTDPSKAAVELLVQQQLDGPVTKVYLKECMDKHVTDLHGDACGLSLFGGRVKYAGNPTVLSAGIIGVLVGIVGIGWAILEFAV
jgi:hypothetical protein